MRMRVLAVVVATTALGLLGACGEDRQPLATGEQIRIEGSEMAFTPAALTTATGRHLIVFTNVGAVRHELAVASPAGTVLVARSIGAGETVAFDVALEKAGIYRLLCREPGHTNAGMAGTLTVTG